MEGLGCRAGISFRPWIYAVAVAGNTTSEGGRDGGGVINLVSAVNWMSWDLGEKGAPDGGNLKVPTNRRYVVASIACWQITSRERYRHEAREGG